MGLAAAPAWAATINWTNTSGGDWSVAANWSPNQVPGAADDAAISAAGTYTVTITADESVNTLTLGGASGAQTLNLSGGTFTLNAASTGNAQAVFNISGGTLAGAGALVLAGPLTWSGGTISGVVQCNGGTFSGSPLLNGGQMVNRRTVSWTAGVMYTGSGSILSNAATGIINVTANFQEYPYGGTSAFNNAGQLNVAVPGTVTIIDAFTNTGTVAVTGGTLVLAGDHSLTGGTLNFGINGLNNYGSNTLSGASALAGTLRACLKKHE